MLLYAQNALHDVLFGVLSLLFQQEQRDAARAVRAQHQRFFNVGRAAGATGERYHRGQRRSVALLHQAQGLPYFGHYLAGARQYKMLVGINAQAAPAVGSGRY